MQPHEAIPLAGRIILMAALVADPGAGGEPRITQWQDVPWDYQRDGKRLDGSLWVDDDADIDRVTGTRYLLRKFMFERRDSLANIKLIQDAVLTWNRLVLKEVIEIAGGQDTSNLAKELKAVASEFNQNTTLLFRALSHHTKRVTAAEAHVAKIDTPFVTPPGVSAKDAGKSSNEGIPPITETLSDPLTCEKITYIFKKNYRTCIKQSENYCNVRKVAYGVYKIDMTLLLPMEKARARYRELSTNKAEK